MFNSFSSPLASGCSWVLSLLLSSARASPLPAHSPRLFAPHPGFSSLGALIPSSEEVRKVCNSPPPPFYPLQHWDRLGWSGNMNPGLPPPPRLSLAHLSLHHTGFLFDRAMFWVNPSWACWDVEEGLFRSPSPQCQQQQRHGLIPPLHIHVYGFFPFDLALALATFCKNSLFLPKLQTGSQDSIKM